MKIQSGFTAPGKVFPYVSANAFNYFALFEIADG